MQAIQITENLSATRGTAAKIDGLGEVSAKVSDFAQLFQTLPKAPTKNPVNASAPWAATMRSAPMRLQAADTHSNEIQVEDTGAPETMTPKHVLSDAEVHQVELPIMGDPGIVMSGPASLPTHLLAGSSAPAISPQDAPPVDIRPIAESIPSTEDSIPTPQIGAKPPQMQPFTGTRIVADHDIVARTPLTFPTAALLAQANGTVELPISLHQEATPILPEALTTGAEPPALKYSDLASAPTPASTVVPATTPSPIPIKAAPQDQIIRPAPQIDAMLPAGRPETVVSIPTQQARAPAQQLYGDTIPTTPIAPKAYAGTTDLSLVSTAGMAEPSGMLSAQKPDTWTSTIPRQTFPNTNRSIEPKAVQPQVAAPSTDTTQPPQAARPTVPEPAVTANSLVPPRPVAASEPESFPQEIPRGKGNLTENLPTARTPEHGLGARTFSANQSAPEQLRPLPPQGVEQPLVRIPEKPLEIQPMQNIAQQQAATTLTMASATVQVAASSAIPVPVSQLSSTATSSALREKNTSAWTSFKDLSATDQTAMVTAPEARTGQQTRKTPQFSNASGGTGTPTQPMPQLVQPDSGGFSPGKPGSVGDAPETGKEITAPELPEQASKPTVQKSDAPAAPDTMQLATGALDGDPAVVIDSDLPLEFSSDPARIETPKELARVLADPRVPRHVAAQLVGLARHMPNGPVELTLSPEELGRVRMTLHATEHTMTVTLAVERNETADLLRRNIDALGQEFRAMGYSDVSFSFTGGQTDGGGRENNPQPFGPPLSTSGPDTETNVPTPPVATMTLGGGMDLRL